MSQKGPVPSGRSYHSLASGGRDPSAPTLGWAEGPGFLSSLPSPAGTVRVRIVLRPYPLDTGAWAHPPSFKGEKPPIEAQAWAATAGGAGRGAICPWIPESPVAEPPTYGPAGPWR